MLLRLPPRQNVGPAVDMNAEEEEGFRFWQQQQRYFAQQQGALAAATSEEEKAESHGWWCLILGVSCFVLLFVFLSVFWWWRPSGVVFVANKMTQALSRTGGRGKGHCTTDEDFDERSQMCIMRAHYPRAISEAIMDKSVSPCTDIYRYACGKWMDEHTNENRGFAGLRALNEVSTTEIVMDPKVTPAHNLFQSCASTLAADSQTRRQRNWKSHTAETAAARASIMHDMLEPIATGNLKEGLPVAFARMIASDYTVPLSFGFQSHPTGKGLIPSLAYNGFDSASLDVEWVAMHFQQLYSSQQPASAQATALEEARKLIDMVAKLNMATPDMSTLTSLEQWTTYVNTTVEGDLMTWDAFKKSSGSFNWDTFVSHLEVRAKLPSGSLRFSPSQEVWAFSASYFHWFHPEKFGAGQWKRFIQWSVLYHTHEYFPQLPRTSLFTGTALSGKGASDAFDRRPPGPAKKRRRSSPKSGRRQRGHGNPDEDVGEITTADCIEMTKFMLPGVISQEYLKRNFARGEQIRTRVKGVVEAIKKRFVANIMGTQWMDEPTRRLQAEKIDAIVARVVHPNEWEVEKLDMKPDQYLRNLNLIQQDRVRRNLLLWSESHNGAKCGPSCRDQITAFGTPLSTVNAWYNPDRNLITIPAGILQPPFFEERYDDVSVYATIGMVVAHELSHALDPHGSLFDKDGVLHDTWSAQARKTYREKALCIVHEYGSPEGCDNAHYGEQTLCEDTADIVGVRLAYEALGAKLKKDKQDFHVAFAQMWCASYEPAILCDTANNDVHAVASMRVRKTLAHLPYFAEDYDCPVGSPMHRTASERCAIYLNETLAA